MNTDKTTGNEFSDPFDTAGQVPPEIVANPYPTYRRMHERGPIHYYKSLDVWSLIGYEDISNAFPDKRLSADRISVYDSKLPDSMKESMAPVLNIFSNTMLFSDGADHTRLRSLANKAFTPRVVQGMREHIQAIVDDAISAIQSSGRIDVIKDLAYPLPVKVICEMLGVA